MSYDVWLEVDVGGPEPLAVWDGWNYTSNCAPMWRSAGADLAEFHGRRAADCIPALEAAIKSMEMNPDSYRVLNPKNGWGDYDSLLPALRDLLEAFRRAPKARVVVDR